MRTFLIWVSVPIGIAMAVLIILVMSLVVHTMFFDDVNLIPHWPVESVIRDKSGDTVIMCGSEFGWVSKSDAVREIRYSKTSYSVRVPNHGMTDFNVTLAERQHPHFPTILTTSPTNPAANLLDTLPTCNVADFHPHVPRH